MKKRVLSLLLSAILCISLCPSAFASNPIRIAVIDSGIEPLLFEKSQLDAGENYVFPGKNTKDRYGHGTMVASVIAGSKNLGLTGICPEATLVPLVWNEGHYQDNRGKNTEKIINYVSQGIYDAVDRYGCRIINLSLALSTDSEKLHNAVDYAHAHGVLVVASAGNSQKDKPNAVMYPGGYNSVLCVGACDSEKHVADFSQRYDEVDLLAPGVNIAVADTFGEVIRESGTSFSAPYIAGIAAKIWINVPSLSLKELTDVILSCTDSVEQQRVINADKVAQYIAAHAAAQPSLSPASSSDSRFAGVSPSDYYYDAVVWAADRGVLLSSEAFNANTVTTRGQMVTFMWRAAGSPDSALSGSSFADIARGSKYERAVAWAVERGITTGVGGNRFAPDEEVTRAQAVTFLARMCGVSDNAVGYHHSFTDVKATDYCSNAVAWAASNGITTGTSATAFSPNNPCLHSQIITFLYRSMNK